MKNFEKVIQAYKLAKLSAEVPNLTFDVEAGSTTYVRFHGQRILEFDRVKEATSVAASLNSVIAPVLDSIKQEYDKRIGEILNA